MVRFEVRSGREELRAAEIVLVCAFETAAFDEVADELFVSSDSEYRYKRLHAL